MTFFKESELKSKQPRPGVNLRTVCADKAMVTLFDFDPNTAIPAHKHPHEQITYIIKGELEFTLEGKTQLLKEGDGVAILPNLEHSARTLSKPCKVIDAWNPRREDYLT